MTLIATASALAMGAVLLWAGLEKARDPASTSAMLRSLGLPLRLAWPAAILVMAMEISVGVAVLFRPGSTPTHIGVASLAGVFALAGLIAMRSDEPICCNCFGAGGKGYLGVTQLIALLPWLAGAMILRLAAQGTQSLSTGAVYFAITSLVIAAARGIGVRKAQLEARGDRLSAQEMYKWLPSH